MRSRGDSLGGMRAGAEWMLRVLVLGLLVWYLVQVLRARRHTAVEIAASTELASRLVRWSTVAAPGQVHVALDYPPAREQRDWLAALPGAGTAVRWSGTALVPTAATVEPIADPAGGADLAIAAPADARVVLRDVLGPFDTVLAGPSGVRIYLPRPPVMTEVAVGPVVARAALRDSLVLRRLLLLGSAGWEAKFVQAALEERGWAVDAVLAVSPKGQGTVHQGTIGVLDTATYAAVLAIDTVAARYAGQIGRYVRSGGGLVLWSAAARAPAFAVLAPGASAALLPDQGGAPSDTAPRRSLAFTPLTDLHPEALVLERQRRQPAIVAQRLGLGRILEIGYTDTWRWRMAGFGDDAPLAHRAWLAHLVAGVAYAGRRAVPAPAGDAAPLAILVDRLGPPSTLAPPDPGTTHGRAWVFGLLAAALLLEWGSRRLRGLT